MKAKHLDKALNQFAEEGAAKLFKPMIGAGWIIGVVGALQFEVLASRIAKAPGGGCIESSLIASMRAALISRFWAFCAFLSWNFLTL